MITKDSVVSIEYVLKDESGNILDASREEPLEYLQGHQNIIPGLERALEGLKVGDKTHVEVQPEDGYGTYDPQMRFTVPVAQFGDQVPPPGTPVQLQAKDGHAIMAQIVGTQDKEVVLDANHPLAGRALFFDVEVKGIRDASAEEKQHGHPHGPGGHHHH